MAVIRDQDSFCSNEKVLGDAEMLEVSNAVNQYTGIGLSDEAAHFYDDFTEDRKARMFRKIDFRLVPVLALLYLAAHIDRANIGNAKIEGLTTDLGLTGIQYNIA